MNALPPELQRLLDRDGCIEVMPAGGVIVEAPHRVLSGRYIGAARRQREGRVRTIEFLLGLLAESDGEWELREADPDDRDHVSVIARLDGYGCAQVPRHALPAVRAALAVRRG